MNNTLTIKLIEDGIPSKAKQHKLHVDFCGAYTSSCVGIRIDGYGDRTSIDGEGSPVLISIQDGIPRVYIWADINKEDPTHIISLAGASEDNRKEKEPYRIVPGNTGFGWVTVEKWNDSLGRYAPTSSFRTLEDAQEFIEQH